MASKEQIEDRLTRPAHWQQYAHDEGHLQSDGSLLIPADLVARWQHQIVTPYAELTAKEKESDREQVRKHLPVVLHLILE